MTKIRKLSVMAAASFLLLSPGFVSASSYWQTSSGTALQDTSGACVIAAVAQHSVLACQPADRVILLPGKDGKAGAVSVSAQGATYRLDQAYKTVATTESGLEEAQLSAGQVASEFGQLLEALPLPVVSFTVKFISGSATELTSQSAKVIEQLIVEIEGREAAEIRLVGHTDTVGELLKNDRLSQKRAQAVVDILVGQGIPAESMEATGRGEREPAVATVDNVSEAANRRVDIRVR